MWVSSLQFSCLMSSSLLSASAVESCRACSPINPLSCAPLCRANIQQFSPELSTINKRKHEMSLPWRPTRADMRRYHGARVVHELTSASYSACVRAFPMPPALRVQAVSGKHRLRNEGG